MPTNLTKTDIRRRREETTGTAERKRLSVLKQCDVGTGRFRQDMTGSKINEAIRDLIEVDALELLSSGEGGRCCRTTDKGRQFLKEGQTCLANRGFVRDE